MMAKPSPARTIGSSHLNTKLQRQRTAFAAQGSKTYAERLDALDALMEGLSRYQQDFIDALIEDYGNRAPQETQLLELFPVIDEIRHTKRHLKQWMRPKRVSSNWQFSPSSAKVVYQPLGVVGIIGAWNYQILLTLSPLVCALSAGNHAMIKPSEMAPVTAELLKTMIAEVFPNDYVTVVTGGAEVSAAFSSLAFDHLIFTGSGRIGKLVMRAAAENLTPVTLELGGKSPALIHPDYSISRAAERICSGKFWNAGQTCVAPDYVLVHNDKKDEFMKAAEQVVSKRYPKIVDTPDYTRVINEPGYERLNGMIEEARALGATVNQINPSHEDCNASNRVIPPTIVSNAPEEAQVLQDEIFGPILPVVTYKTLHEAIGYINSRPRPLALYYFDDNKGRVDHILQSTTSGGVTINDVIFHLPQNNLPFGGVGPSGMGHYHGDFGFQTFSKAKGVFTQSRLTAWVLSKILTPPYGKLFDWAIGFLIFRRQKEIAKKQ